MSTTRKGDSTKKGQRHQNSWTYKPGLHRTGKQRVQNAVSLPLCGLCPRCKEKIEWKRKYDKYKPLSAPRKCTVCGGHKVRQAYYHICPDCSKERGVCSKCGKIEEITESYLFTGEERREEGAEMRGRLGPLRERERRTILRNASRETEDEEFSEKDKSQKSQKNEYQTIGTVDNAENNFS